MTTHDSGAPTANVERPSSRFGRVHGEHVVQLYRDDPELIGTLSDYILEVLGHEREGVLVLATRRHCDELRDVLQAGGIKVRSAIAARHVTFVAVEDAMPKFMRGEQPDYVLFKDLVEALIRRCHGDGRYQHLHVFGEIVDLLWRAGNVDGTIKIEQVWNELHENRPFTLYCAFQGELPFSELLGGRMEPVLAAHALVHQQNVTGPSGVFVPLARSDAGVGDVLDGELGSLVPSARAD